MSAFFFFPFSVLPDPASAGSAMEQARLSVLHRCGEKQLLFFLSGSESKEAS